MKLELFGIQRQRTGSPESMAFEVPKSRRVEYREFIIKAHPADRFDLVLSTPRKKRTTGPWSQNHRLNGHCAQIAQETGQDFDTVKLYCKRAAIKRGLPLKIGPNGDPVYSILDGEPVPISESEMDTIQCGWVIEEVNILAAELGIILRED